jgi:hypothetical protein
LAIIVNLESLLSLKLKRAREEEEEEEEEIILRDNFPARNTLDVAT